MRNLLNIFKTLGLNNNNGLYFTNENKWLTECNFPSRIKRLINKKLKPDAFFVFDNKPLILFYDSPDDINSIHKALWNFNETPIVIFGYSGSIEIFNGFHYLNDKSSLKKISSKKNLNDFNYFELVSGRTWEKYKAELKYESRVDFNLLKNIKAARDILINNQNLIPDIANALIGKVLFVRYLIDRKVIIGFTHERNWSNSEFCSILSNKNETILFFKYLEEKFHGDMFELEDCEYQDISQESLNTIINLLNEDDLGNGQKSLFKLYDFSIIPIEFISNVYESFIGELNQKREGAYYTPIFLVDYILNETIENHLNKCPNNYECKVLDPACGSGIFLVESLRKIIDKFLTLNPNIKEDSDYFKNSLRELALNNIFGIDKNLSAIRVAIFSIQLTLLDYQNPSSIETFKFPKLLDTNFFKANFFDTKHEFNDVLKEKGLDFILGNPPWKGNGIGSLGNKYLKKRLIQEDDKNKKYPIAINNGEIVEGFVLRVSDFTTPRTEISLIVRSNILYNLGYKKEKSAFRDYWMEEFYINKVFELAPVRKEVFDKSNDPSIAPPAILFYKYANGENTDTNIINHITLKPSSFFSLFKVFSISRNDIQWVDQINLKKFDWLWKVLVYGSYLDFIFIANLKNSYPSISDIISDTKNFLVGTGIQYSSDPKESSEHLKGIPLLNTRAVKDFYIDYSNSSPFNKSIVHRRRNKKLFEAPMLLLREGLDIKSLKVKSAISYENLIFKDSITSIKPLNTDSMKLLRIINGLYSSSLYVYFTINTFSSIGIERERAKNYNKFSTPFVFSEIEDVVSKIERLMQTKEDKNKKLLIDENEIIKIDKEINKELGEIDFQMYKTLNLSDKEHSLINYALEVNRPIITNNQVQLKKTFKSIDFKAEYLEDYAKLFLNRFSKSLKNTEYEFIIEIWYSKQIIGMFFKVVQKKENMNNLIWFDKSTESIFQTAIDLSADKITDMLFIQKDIRGFEKDYFYLFKPNESQFWHKAIGYQDTDEFMNAILRTGRKDYVEE